MEDPATEAGPGREAPLGGIRAISKDALNSELVSANLSREVMHKSLSHIRVHGFWFFLVVTHDSLRTFLLPPSQYRFWIQMYHYVSSSSSSAHILDCFSCVILFLAFDKDWVRVRCRPLHLPADLSLTLSLSIIAFSLHQTGYHIRRVCLCMPKGKLH